MGGTITKVLNFAGSIYAEKTRQLAIDEKNREFEVTDNPMPPFFFKTRSERALNLQDSHPYSVTSIQESLNAGAIPAGYSEETLRVVGFGPEYDRMIARMNNVIQTTITGLNNLYREMIETINRRLATDRSGAYNTDLLEKIESLVMNNTEDRSVDDRREDLREIRSLAEVFNTSMDSFNRTQMFDSALQQAMHDDLESLRKGQQQVDSLIRLQILKMTRPEEAFRLEQAANAVEAQQEVEVPDDAVPQVTSSDAFQGVRDGDNEAF